MTGTASLAVSIESLSLLSPPYFFRSFTPTSCLWPVSSGVAGLAVSRILRSGWMHSFAQP